MFLRLLGLVYAIAFASLLVQVAGLVGDRGVLPAHDLLEAVHRAYGASAYWLLPTVNWLASSTFALQLTCGAGLVASLAVLAGWATLPALAVCWALYLSLVGVGQDFLSFQWDILLLEAGFLAMLLFAWPRAVVWMYRWLLFRLIFLSGAVKLLSGDPSWRSLTALTYHFHTQPLPNLVAWYVDHLPASVLKEATIGTFVAELAVPLLFFAPRRARLAGGVLTIGFQALIFLTGNYTFFNILTVAIAVWLFDDPALRRALPVRWRPVNFGGPPSPPRVVTMRVAAAVLSLIGLASVGQVLRVFGVQPPPPLPSLEAALEPLHVTSSYGLFAVMTTTRPEIVFEGSNDGQTWREYVFRYKPGPLDRPPGQVAPYQPRLDWQMWFAALGDLGSNRWVIALTRRLLEGSPDVLGLLERPPFPNGPPRYVRALVYDYRFTDLDTERTTGRWWKRSLVGTYLPPVRLEDVTPPAAD